jgi:hypothetical protein
MKFRLGAPSGFGVSSLISAFVRLIRRRCDVAMDHHGRM